MRVLGIVAVLEHAAANAEHHAAVTIDKGGKRRLVVLGQKLT